MTPPLSHSLARLIPMIVAAVAGCAPARVATGSAAIAPLPTGFPTRCDPSATQVMLLGTYHFAGSSRDAVQSPAEDILSERRQRELEALVDRLARWEPQQVAVEWPASFADSTTARYRRYVASGGGESRNEVVQLGFRLARRLGHETVYPIDYQMALGNDSLAPLLERRPDLRARADSLLERIRSASDARRAWHEAATLSEQLAAANGEEALQGGNSLGMFGAWIGAGEGDNLGGPQLLARWYERNLIMVHHLTGALRPGTQRVLLLVGSGHVPPIRNILHEAPGLCPVSPLPLLR